MPETETFESILASARDGSTLAFEILWRDLHPPLIRYLRVASPDAAEDLASETWLQVARDLQRFRGDESAFRRWFFTIARHRVLDHARGRRRGPAEHVPTDALVDIPDLKDPIEESLSTSTALALIATLPRAQAEAVALRVVARLSVADVARVMGKRPGAVRVLASRGLRTLAERLSSTRTRDLAREP